MPDSPKLDRSGILVAAAKIIDQDRHEEYGDAKTNFRNIAAMWNAYLNGPIAQDDFIALDEIDVCSMMVLLKVARTINGKATTPDTFIDMAGYAALAGELALYE